MPYSGVKQRPFPTPSTYKQTFVLVSDFTNRLQFIASLCPNFLPTTCEIAMKIDPYHINSTNNPTPASIRTSAACKAILAAFFLAFGVFAWAAFAIVPPPNPWMMGEVAFTKIMITYGVTLIGLLVVCISAPVADWQLKTKMFRWLALPCAALLIVLIARGLLGFPLSIG